MNNFIFKLIFYFTMMTGSLISISSFSWFGMWLGLEINLLSFIPLMIDKKNLNSNEAAIKYFFIQAFASLIFLFSSLMYFYNYNFLMTMMSFNYENLLIISSMSLKLGMAPFHFWFPNVIEGLSWLNSLLILIWQKLAPLMIISYTLYSNLIFLLIIFSAFTGALGGLNQVSLRKILAYSSINHLSWLLISNFYSNSLWVFYFFMYSLINLSITFSFYLMNLYNLNQLFLFKNNEGTLKFLILMNFLSLGGLPPFLGFLPKWLVLEMIIYSKNFFLLFLMIMSTLITLFFYARVCFSAFLFNYPSINKLNYYTLNKNSYYLKFTVIFNSIAIFSFFVVLINFYNIF